MSKINLIIADANIKNALELRSTLMRFGYHVVAIASSSQELIALTGVLMPDLVVTEISLKEKADGIEAAAIVQSELYVPVVFLTEQIDYPLITQAQNIKPYGFVVKPASEMQLQIAIKVALDRHHAKTGIRQQLSQAEKLKAFKSELISMLCHDGRAPLTSILMSLDLIQRYEERGTEAQKLRCLNRIKASVEHLNQLMEDVLTTDCADTTSEQLHIAPIDLVDFCRQVIDEVSHNSGDRNQIEFHSLDCSQLFYTDQRLLHHILYNLISNAIKYSPANGKVEVYLACLDSEIEIRVCDQGIGIPAGDVARLFNPFFRARNVSGHRGNGLGLTIVKRCLDNLSGSIRVSSEEGKGSMFTIQLPQLNQTTQPQIELFKYN